MYVIAVYDIGEKRVGKMLKVMRQYLNWIQNSVFEGEISEAKLKEMVMQARQKMDLDEDSLLIFKLRDNSLLKKDVIGIEKNPLDTMI